ncbi:MAG: MaoC family dehydratase [Pseudomonadota bacterium]|nr:MaoC family dehydratase [Pseudomonadota bacterium]
MAQPLLHFEDFPLGEVFEYGSYRVTAEEIVGFAREFDPQPFHIDAAAAEASILGGLCASGWHTCAIMMRMMVDGYLGRSASMGSSGIEETRWLKPVYAGDTLTCRRTTLEARRSARRPEMGVLRFRWELFNLDGDRKTEMTGVTFIRARSTA